MTSLEQHSVKNGLGFLCFLDDDSLFNGFFHSTSGQNYFISGSTGEVPKGQFHECCFDRVPMFYDIQICPFQNKTEKKDTDGSMTIGKVKIINIVCEEKNTEQDRKILSNEEKINIANKKNEKSDNSQGNNFSDNFENNTLMSDNIISYGLHVINENKNVFKEVKELNKKEESEGVSKEDGISNEEEHKNNSQSSKSKYINEDIYSGSYFKKNNSIVFFKHVMRLGGDNCKLISTDEDSFEFSTDQLLVGDKAEKYIAKYFSEKLFNRNCYVCIGQMQVNIDQVSNQ